MDFSLAGMWGSMGLFAKGITLVLAAMSVASLTIMAERMIVYQRSSGRSRDFAARLNGLIGKGDFPGMVEAGATASKGDSGGHLGRVLGSGLAAFKSAHGRESDIVVDSVSRALERTSSRELSTLKRGLGLLATVGSTSPFVGLLGTVTGIINTFQLMKGGSVSLSTVGPGISEALVTTAFGLLVAIPAVMGFNLLNARVDGFSVDMQESGNELVDMVAKNADKKLER
jgi:biopolymer transport protein ExbB/biopolymer transport protein TolQ